MTGRNGHVRSLMSGRLWEIAVSSLQGLRAGVEASECRVGSSIVASRAATLSSVLANPDDSRQSSQPGTDDDIW